MSASDTNGHPSPEIHATPVKVKPYSFSRSEREAVQRAINLSLSRHFLEGSSTIVNGIPSLHFRIPDSVPPQALDANRVLIWPWGWGGLFGNSVTYSLAIKGIGFVSRVVVPNDTPAFALLKQGHFVAAFVMDRTPALSWEIEYLTSPTNVEFYRKSCAGAEKDSAVFPDKDAHFWDVLSNLRSFHGSLTRKDKLSIGWVRSFKVEVKHGLHYFEQACSTGLSDLDLARFSPYGRSFLESMASQNYSLYAAVSKLSDGIKEDAEYLGSLFQDFASLAAEDEWQVIGNAFGSAVFCCHTGPRATKCGKRLTWIDGPSAAVSSVDVDVDKFPEDFPPEEYWPRIPHDHRVNWGRVLDGSEVPISPAKVSCPGRNFPVATDLAEVDASSDALLDEALANKKWTIPPGAVVELEFGPFACLEAHEVNEEVFFACWTSIDEFLVVWVDPRVRQCSFRVSPIDNQDPNQKEEARKVDAAIKLLLSAVIRDFWVVEERERVFATKTQERRRRRENKEGPSIVYLPRIRFIRDADIRRCESELGQQERRAHFVRAHLRKVGNPSEDQLILAHRYGLSVPVGYTFVRPHERGKKAREVIYRSRSALQSLYSVVEHAGGGPTDWFRFERDVYSLMSALGFFVEHISASRRGDHGVDVFATKGSDLDQVNWIIQCKCFGPGRKVGPEAVRDLVGALANHPAGTRGMVVTTSAFTRGAVEQAEKHGVRLIDGNEFVRLLATCETKV